MLNANKVPSTGRAPIPPLDAGTYPTRIVQIVDLGLQNQRPFKGEAKPPAFEILVTYEFVDEFVPDEDGQLQPDKPRWLSETMPLHSLKAEKAKSTKRYLALDPKQEYGGDWSALTDTPCLVTVVQNPKPERIYENIVNVGPMRNKDAQNCLPLVNAPIVFDLDNPSLEDFEALPGWIQEKVMNNLNYRSSALEALLEGEKVQVEDDAGVGSDGEMPF